MQVLSRRAECLRSFVDPAGFVFEADRLYKSGSWRYQGGAAKRTLHRVYRSDHDPLFQAVWEGMQFYRFDLQDGSYEVTFGFLEMDHDAPGKRKFSVNINGERFLISVDLAATASRWTAVEHRRSKSVTGGSGIHIVFEAIVGPPTLSAVRIERK